MQRGSKQPNQIQTIKPKKRKKGRKVILALVYINDSQSFCLCARENNNKTEAFVVQDKL